MSGSENTTVVADIKPPRVGLVRRIINDVEYWVHEITHEIHSPVFHQQTVSGPNDVAPKPEVRLVPGVVDPPLTTAQPEPAPEPEAEPDPKAKAKA